MSSSSAVVRAIIPKRNTLLNVCPQGYHVVRERFGRYAQKHTPGLFFAIPLIDRLKYVDGREICMRIEPQSGITKDNVSVRISGSLYVRFDDPYKACYGAQDPIFALCQFAQSTMRSEIGRMELDVAIHSRALINAGIEAAISKPASEWGAVVTRYEATDIDPDKEIQRAMDLQASAERRRRGDVLAADGHKQAAVLSSEGDRQRLINEASGRAEAITRVADAQAKALSAVASAIRAGGDEGYFAVRVTLAREWFESFGKLAKSSNTMIVPADAGDARSMIAQAMAVVGASSAAVKFGTPVVPEPVPTETVKQT